VIIFDFKKHDIFLKPSNFFEFFLKYIGKMVGAGAEIFVKLEPEPHKNRPAPQHWVKLEITYNCAKAMKAFRYR
jgi:hypothetical protein